MPKGTFYELCVARFEVDKYALRGFGAEIDGGCRIFRHADKCLEHEVEFLTPVKLLLPQTGRGICAR